MGARLEATDGAGMTACEVEAVMPIFERLPLRDPRWRRWCSACPPSWRFVSTRRRWRHMAIECRHCSAGDPQAVLDGRQISLISWWRCGGPRKPKLGRCLGSPSRRVHHRRQQTYRLEDHRASGLVQLIQAPHHVKVHDGLHTMNADDAFNPRLAIVQLKPILILEPAAVQHQPATDIVLPL